ncbi:MAG: elongation factor 4 [Acetilactobacillus jinshanensis]
MDLKKMQQRQKYIRNFSIVAHIDHGKSTLADRILELTDTVAKRDMKNQILDNMPVERERGITVKLNAVQLTYHAKDGHDYIFHLIDTPGHADFSYEVSRSLAACEGAILVVDASQGVEAQTIANVYLAINDDLKIIPDINKIDLPSAQPEKTKKEIEDVIGIDASNAALTSAKYGTGVPDLMEKIVHDIPAPKGDVAGPLKALVFDSAYDDYRGVVLSVRLYSGYVKAGDRIRMMNGKHEFTVTEVGVNSPKPINKPYLMAGDVGYLTASIKDITTTRVGDTVTKVDHPAKHPLPGYRERKPMVYAGLYPTSNSKFEELRESLEKLKLNDAALEFKPESSKALGFGFRCGFLGLLHMSVVQERLEQEFNMNLITTAPSVTYKAILNNGKVKNVENPYDMPDPGTTKEIEEPYVKVTVMTPSKYIGAVMKLCQDRRGKYTTMRYLDKYHVDIVYSMPLSEIIYDFYDHLKSKTRGYASYDYDLEGYKASDLVKIDILLNGSKVDALSFISHRSFAYSRSREMVNKLKKLIPRQNFEIPVQAAIGAKIIARATIKPYRKDVTGPLYGGDQTRKDKLLKKQKAGKKRMKAVGKVVIPQSAFMAVFKTDEAERGGK